MNGKQERPARSFGMDSNWVLEVLMGAEGRDPEVANKSRTVFTSHRAMTALKKRKREIETLRELIGAVPDVRGGRSLPLEHRARRGGRGRGVKYIKKGREPPAQRVQCGSESGSPQSFCVMRRWAAMSSRPCAIRLLREQGSLCAYTMVPIGRETVADFHIEHIRPQWRDPVKRAELWQHGASAAPGGDVASNCEWGAVKKRGAEVDQRVILCLRLSCDCETAFCYGRDG